MCQYKFPVSNSDNLIIQVMNSFLFEDRATAARALEILMILLTSFYIWI